MKNFSILILLLFTTISFAQPTVEMTNRGFTPIVFTTPDRPMDKLIEAAKAWAPYYNKKGYDVYDTTENSLSIDGFIENAYFYRNRGQRYDNHIKYTLKVSFNSNKTYSLTFILKEVYSDKVLTKTTVSDFFTSDGNLKEDFEEVKPSLESTANKVIRSFSEYIAGE